MCGVAGYLGPHIEPLPLARAFNEALAHRGPDGQGFHVERMNGRSLVLAHTRLAIIDPSPSGHQPMRDPGTGNILVFNGEIYNYRDFGTVNDGAAILRAYEAEGEACLHRLRGMFALALWDSTKRQLFLAVDHCGIKPLYWCRGPGGRFAFASEVRAILASGLVPREIDPAGLAGFLRMGAVQAPDTIIRGVRAMLPGTCLTVSEDGSVWGPRAWWTPPFVREGEPGIRPEPLAIRNLMEEAVREHLVADVPVGLFLSGGMDSGAVAGLAAGHCPDIRAFSVTFPGWAGSEDGGARETAASHGLRLTEIPMSEADALAAVPANLEAQDQPSFDGLNTFVIARAVRAHGLKCALSGMGGDEIFGGYSTFRQIPVLTKWAERLGPLASTIPAIGRYKDAFRRYFRRKGLFPAEDVRRIMVRDEPEPGWDLAAWTEEWGQCFRSVSILDPVNAVSLLEIRVYLANMLLRDTDCMSMAHGLEVRVPMLDRRLVEYMARVPGAFKVSRWRHKPLLLDACRDLLPPAIYRRPKGGFSFPWDRWLRGVLRPMAEEALNDAGAWESLSMEPGTVRRSWDAYLKGRLRWCHIWALVALRAWAKRPINY